MIAVNKDILATLRRAGLNQYESKAYLVLLSSSTSSATELANKAAVPRPRIYDVLTSLEKKGFVVMSPGRPTKYNALAIDAAISNLKKAKEEDHRKEIEELQKLEESLLAAANTIEKEDSASEKVWMFKDRESTYSALENLIENAENSIVIASHKEGLERKKATYEKHLKQAKKKGVEVKLVESPHRMAIVDDHVVLFLNNGENEKQDCGTWIQSKFVADSFRKLF